MAHKRRYFIFLCLFFSFSNIFSHADYDICKVIAIPPYFKDFISIEMDLYTIRKIQPEDVDDLFILMSDAKVAEFAAAFELHATKEQTKELIIHMRQRYEENKPTRWAIVEKLTGKVIGIAGFVAYSAESARAELGYALNREYWGKGIATCVCRAIIAYGFKHMHLNRVDATVDIENSGSIRVLEKLGMKEEGFLRQYTRVNDVFHDRKIYSILCSQKEAT